MVVAAPNAFTVVAFVFAKLNVVVDTVRSPPSMLTSPSTSKLLLILVVPVAAPISIVVAAPAKFTVVALVFARLKVVVDTVRSPPSILTSPSTSRLLLMLVVPVAAPSSRVVAEVNAFTVVAFVVARLKVEVETVRSPPSMLTSPSTSRLLLILVVPVAAPISIVVAAPAKFTVVAVPFNRLKVV